jgi:hypothetical protein
MEEEFPLLPSQESAIVPYLAWAAYAIVAHGRIVHSVKSGNVTFKTSVNDITTAH